MRFIVREQGYEQPIAAGLFRYERDGAPTGTIEQWRLTRAVEGYHILRVDLDAREAASGDSYIYHMVRQDGGTPERLAYRYWGSGMMIEGTLLFSEHEVTSRRIVNGRQTEETVSLPHPKQFWFPSAIGLGIAAQLGQAEVAETVTLENKPGNEETLALKKVTLSKEEKATHFEQVMVGQKHIDATPTTLHWKENVRHIWLEPEKRWPLKIEREDGLTAVETRNIWY